MLFRSGRLDGLAVCAQIKADERLGSTPVVMMTALGQPSDVEAGLKAGADAYLVKPFSFVTLVETIEQCLVQGPARPAG